MANLLYEKGKENFLGANIDLSGGVIRAVLVDITAGYTRDPAHDAYDDLGANIVGTESPAFATVSITDGIFDADDITFATVSGAEAGAVVIFLDTGVPANDLLIAYIDTATGLPVTPNGGDIVVQWDAGANKIFAL